MKGTTLDAGRRLRRWLTRHYDVAEVEPVIAELCKTANDLARTDSDLAQATSPAERGQIMSARVRLRATFCRLWRLAGLDQAEDISKKGKPSASELGRKAAMARWHPEATDDWSDFDEES